MRVELMLKTLILTLAMGLVSLSGQIPDEISSQLVVADTSEIQSITLKNGDKLTGRITAVRDDEIDFRTNVGTMQIKTYMIKDIYVADASLMRNGRLWFRNPHTTRLFFSPTGRMLPKGEGYYQNIYLFFNGFAYGITDNITIGGGMSIFPTEDFFEDNVFYLTPKFGGYVTDNLSLAAGALFIFLPFNGDTFDESIEAGIAYAAGTIGKPDHSFTFGLGVPFGEGNVADQQIILLGTDLRISERLSFVSENWIITDADDGTMVSYGIRFFGEKLSVDLGFFNAGNNFVFPGYPYVDFVVKF